MAQQHSNLEVMKSKYFKTDEISMGDSHRWY